MMNRERLIEELAKQFHPDSSPRVVEGLLVYFGRAMVAAGITEITPEDLGVHR